MLQQNNNNNYPCLKGVDSTPEMFQKCSRASLPFSRGLELGLADLPLIRGLRAWALCTKNRHKAGGLLGGGQAPSVPPLDHRGSTSCSKPADVYLSREWGNMAYGLPLGQDVGQAGIRALVTVATLKTSEGTGKTQTQCLFLQTEKGSCLYSTAKPVSGVTTSASSSVIGGWLKGKTGGRGGASRKPQVRWREQSSSPVAQAGANRVRVRSGRRWRKSCNAAGSEKRNVSRDRQLSSRENPAGEITLDERPEEQDKAGLDNKQFPNPQKDIRNATQEKEEALQSLRCSNNTSPKPCTQYGRKVQRMESLDDGKGAENPRGSTQNSEMEAMRIEKQKNEEKGDLCESDCSNSVLAVLNPDLVSNYFHLESHSNCDIRANRQTESNEEANTQSNGGCSEKEEDANTVVMKVPTNNDLIHSPSEQLMSRQYRERDHRKLRENPSKEAQKEKGTASVGVEEEEESFSQISAQYSAVSNCCENVSYCTSISTAVSPEHSTVESSTYKAEQKVCIQESKDCLPECQQGAAECEKILGVEKLDNREFEQQKCAAMNDNTVNENTKPLFFFENVKNSSHLEDRDAWSTSTRHRDPNIFEIDRMVTAENCSNFSSTVCNGAGHQCELVWENRDEESQEENIEQRVNPEDGGENREIWRRYCTENELDDSNGEGDDDKEQHTGDLSEDRGLQEDESKEITTNCALKDNWRLQVPTDRCRQRSEEVEDTCGQTRIGHAGANREIITNFNHAARVDPSISLTLSQTNPAPSLSLLESMTTSLPFLEAEKEEEGISVSVREGSQEGNRGHGRELEEQGEEKRGFTVATEEESKGEEEEDEFGVFMQAEGEPTWGEGSAMPASVPCGSRASVGESYGCFTHTMAALHIR